MPTAATADDEALRALVDEHGGALLAYLRSQVRDRGRAEDLLQEVLVRAWRRADTYDPRRGDLRGWLFGIARHLVVDLHRADAARPRLAAGESADAVLAALPAEDELEHAVARWEMADALAGLTSAHRDVLVHLYYRRLPVAETAALLGIPVGTVKSRSTYALRALRLVLHERGLAP